MAYPAFTVRDAACPRFGTSCVVPRFLTFLPVVGGCAGSRAEWVHWQRWLCSSPDSELPGRTPLKGLKSEAPNKPQRRFGAPKGILWVPPFAWVRWRRWLCSSPDTELPGRTPLKGVKSEALNKPQRRFGAPKAILWVPPFEWVRWQPPRGFCECFLDARPPAPPTESAARNVQSVALT